MAAKVAWFLWFCGLGWAMFDLMGGIPILEIFSVHKEVPVDMDRVEARLPMRIATAALHLMLCLGIHVAQFVYAMNLPFHKLSSIRAEAAERAEPPESKADLVAALLDREAKAGGFTLDTVHAFLRHADLRDWPTRKSVLSAWLRLQLTELDRQLVAGHEFVEHQGERVHAKDLSMRLQVIEKELRNPAYRDRR